MKRRLQVNLFHPSELLLSRPKEDHSRRKSSIASLQPKWCSPFLACSSLVPPIYSRTVPTSLSNPFPPANTSQNQPPPTMHALVPPTTLPLIPFNTPARIPSSSLILNTTIIPILITMSTIIASPFQVTTPAQVSCITGTCPALLNQRHLSSFLLDPAPIKSLPSCQCLHPLQKQQLPCHPLNHLIIPHHVRPRAPLSSRLLLHPLALTNAAHLLSHRKSL